MPKYRLARPPAVLIAPEGWEHKHVGFERYNGRLVPSYTFVGPGTEAELHEALAKQVPPSGPLESWYDPHRDGPHGQHRVIVTPALVKCPHCGDLNYIGSAEEIRREQPW